MEWKTVFWTILIVFLLLLVIPFNISRRKDTTDADLKLFEEYVGKYKKPYKHDPTEYQRRFSKFQRSLRNIEKLNLLRGTGGNSAIYGPTKFSDLSENEFLYDHLRPDLPARTRRHDQNCDYHHLHHRDPKDRARKIRIKRELSPDRWDWRDHNAVTPVKSQGNCGACWAFSSVQVAESMFAIKNGSLRNFSVQEMIDCARNSNFGCEGGDICSLLEWLIGSKTRILLEKTYPLTRITDTCSLEKVKDQQGVLVSDFSCDNYIDAEEILMYSIANHGPVAAAVNALTWQNYVGGVVQYHCENTWASMNHAVQIVGYDRTVDTPYYIVRNSWGTNFGDQGYIYLAIGGNMCGIANQVSALDIIY